MKNEYIGTHEEWLRLANMDLITARRIYELHRPMPIEIICFHAQQASEKAMKGFLVSNGVLPPKTHDLTKLLKMCIEYEDGLVKFFREADALTLYGVLPRYPTEFELVESDSEIALGYAEKIMEYINGLLLS
ncbi:MAG: HEPN domain-containing protein [Lachnospiraceae bacterium]|jgi:HEPN domain-containing protein|nr:HEPN domain-containing protein [Lachnospiraceae bacterium]